MARRAIKLDGPYRSVAELKMGIHLQERNIPYEHDYKFSKKRKFLLDFAIFPPKIGIEVEGITPKIGRHQRLLGFMKDCEKYNLAAAEGWIIMRIPSLWLMNGSYHSELSSFLDQISSLMTPYA